MNDMMGRSARRNEDANSWNMQYVQRPGASAGLVGRDRAASTNMRALRGDRERPVWPDYSDGETLTVPNRRGRNRRVQGDA